MIKKMISIASACIIGSLLFSNSCFAADSYSVMQPDGVVKKIEDETIDKIVDNIREVSGEEAAKAYIDAMSTGDYKEFYKTVGNNTETAQIREYMQIDGKDYYNIPKTKPQNYETYMQTLIGPNSTVEQAGKAAEEAGFEPTEDGLFDYFLAILLEQAKRPSYAENPAYRISELGYEPRTYEDANLFNNENTLVEYEDQPVTDFQRNICERYGITITKASDMPSNIEATQETDDAEDETTDNETAVENTDTADTNNLNQTESLSQKTGLTLVQFVLMAIITVILSSIITIIISTRKPRRKK